MAPPFVGPWLPCPLGGGNASEVYLQGEWYEFTQRPGAPPGCWVATPLKQLAIERTPPTIGELRARLETRLAAVEVPDIEADLQDARLDLDGVPLSGNDLTRVADAGLSYHSLIAHLSLAKCGLGNAGVAFLSKALSQSASLQKLSLADNHFGQVGAEKLASALLQDGVALSHISVAGNDLRLHGAQKFARALEKNTKLQVLDMSDCRLGEQGCARLAVALQFKNRTLTSLNIDGNGAGRFGGEKYAEVLLSDHPALTSLSLARNALETYGVEQVAVALEKSTVGLLELNVAGNLAEDRCALRLAEALDARASRGARPLSIDISQNPLGRKAAQRLAASVATASAAVKDEHT